MKKILVAAVAAAFLAGCAGPGPGEAGLKPINQNLDIKIPCKSVEWEAVTTVIEGKNTVVTKSRVYYRKGRLRLEILSPQGTDKQVILMDKNNLYVLGHDNRAYMYDANARESEVFLRRVFINTGLGRKPEIKAGEAVYNGKKCSLYEYEILRSVNGLYAKAIVKEWRDKKGATVRMESTVGPSEFQLAGGKLVVGPIKEVYETSNYKCKTQMGLLFEVPMGMKITDQQEVYMEQMKKSGKKITEDPGMVTVTVKPRIK